MLKLIDVSDRHTRLKQLAGVLSSFALIGAGAVALATGKVPTGSAALSIVLGVGFLIVVGSIRQRWTVDYKGHEIRFENSPLTGERLYLDGGLVARGGIGLKMELRAPIRVGAGAGEELVALVDAGVRTFRLRLFVDGAEHDMSGRQAPPVTTAAESGALGPLILAKTVMEILSSAVTLIGAIGAAVMWLKL